MSRTRVCNRLLLVALVAIAGTVHGASEAVAGPVSSGAASESCCARPMPAGCTCCPTEAAHDSATHDSSPALAGQATHVSRPHQSCSCRPADPARRDTRHESRTPERRPTESAEHLPLLSLAASRLVPATRPVGASHREHSPLFLRTEHLRL